MLVNENTDRKQLYNMRNVFLKTSYTPYSGEASPGTVY